MVLIGLDTSGKNGSLTLARVPEGGAGEGEVQILETVGLEGGTFSAQLIPQLAELLARNGFSKVDIGAFAVVAGPGSFTGLRVGLAAVKGLAEVLQKPIVALSLLDLIARSVRERHVVAALDAGRNELYVGEYEDGVVIGEEQLKGRSEFLSSIALQVVTTDASLVKQLREAHKAAALVEHPGSAGAARLGWQKLQEGERVTPDQLEAHYIRRSDAEIFKGSR